MARPKSNSDYYQLTTLVEREVWAEFGRLAPLTPYKDKANLLRAVIKRFVLDYGDDPMQTVQHLIILPAPEAAKVPR